MYALPMLKSAPCSHFSRAHAKAIVSKYLRHVVDDSAKSTSKRPSLVNEESEQVNPKKTEEAPTRLPKRSRASETMEPEPPKRPRGRPPKDQHKDGHAEQPKEHSSFPKGSWEEHIFAVDNIDETRDPKTRQITRWGYVQWKDGKISKIKLDVLHLKCPKKVRQALSCARLLQC